MDPIKETKLSPHGPVISRIVPGVWKWDVLNTQQILRLVEECIEAGAYTFDHADIYGGYTIEALFGNALAMNPSLRGKMKLITKCGIKLKTANRPHHALKSYDTSAAHIRASVENSLQCLRTDYIDVLLIHRPDPLMHPEEVASTFAELHKEGKVLYFGVSNFTSSQFEMLNSCTHLVTNQVEISALETKTIYDGTLDTCIKHHVKPMAYSPLGSGSIFSGPFDEQIGRVRPTAERLAHQYGKALDQILLTFLLKHPSGIVPVLGTTKADRVRGAIDALNIPLSKEDWFSILEASEGRPVA